MARARLDAPRVLHESRQLHREPRQPLPLARHAGRGARRGDLSGLRGGRGVVHRRRQGARGRHRRHGHRQGRREDCALPAGHRAAGEVHALRGGRARAPGQAPAGTLPPARGRPAAGLRHRPEGAVGSRRGPARARPRGPHGGLAARQRDLRRVVPLPHGEPPGRRGLRGGPRLRESLPQPLRGAAALQDPSGDPRLPRGRTAHLLRRARDRGGRAAVAPEAGVPGRGAGGRRRRLPQRLAHQGHPRGDQVRHARRRGGPRCPRRRDDPTTSWPTIPGRSRRAGCAKSCTERATSSRGCRRDCMSER